MLRLFSSQEILNNYLVLIKPFIKSNKLPDGNTLKSSYLDFLETIQPHCPHMRNKTLFHVSTQVEKDFEGYFGPEFRVPEANETYTPELILYPNPEERCKALKKSFRSLETLDPTFYTLFQLLMNTVFCTSSKRLGGTSVNPSFIGVMCAYYDMAAEETALPELFVHEFTHNCLFLDELRYGHYKNYTELTNTTTYVPAEYRGKRIQLPFDRCFHSLVVSAEIFLAREAYVGHQKRITQHLETKKLIERAKNYITNIKSNTAINTVMKPRCQQIFERCSDLFLSL